MTFSVRRLGPDDLAQMRELNAVFARAFDEPHNYEPVPSDEYVRRILGRDDAIVLAAMAAGQVVGGLVAYVLPKLEQERSEIYIYDLAVAEEHRRRGVATALIWDVQRIATKIGSWVVYVQADHGDEPAISLYGKLGAREEVLHFDIPPARTR